MQKGRPFTRKQRAKALKRAKREAAAERRAERAEARSFTRYLQAFRGCDPARTEGP